MSRIAIENLSPILLAYREDKQAQLSPRSLEQYLRSLDLFQQFIQKDLADITKLDVLKWLGSGQKRGLKSKTVQNWFRAVQSFIKWLWTEDRMDDRTYKTINGIRLRLEKDNEERIALSEEEQKECLRLIAEPQSRMLFFVGVNYGLRLQEYAKLKLSDVDLDNLVLTIRLSKGQKTRRIGILKNQVPEWEKWFVQRRHYEVEHDLVFFTKSGKSMTDRTTQRRFQRMQETVNKRGCPVKFSSHTLRYSFATALWRGGMDVLIISKILGHASITTTMAYLKVRESEILERYRQSASKILV